MYGSQQNRSKQNAFDNEEDEEMVKIETLPSPQASSTFRSISRPKSAVILTSNNHHLNHHHHNNHHHNNHNQNHHNHTHQHHSRSPKSKPSSILANKTENIPTNECCCFSARFVNLVLFLFNFIFLLSGCCILLLTVFYGRPEFSRYLGETTKYLNNIINLLGNGHLVQIIHYSMLFCGVVIIIISLINICLTTSTSWSKSSDHYYYHRRRRHHHHHHRENVNDNETLLLFNGSNSLEYTIDRDKSKSHSILNGSSNGIKTNQYRQSTALSLSRSAIEERKLSPSATKSTFGSLPSSPNKLLASPKSIGDCDDLNRPKHLSHRSSYPSTITTLSSSQSSTSSPSLLKSHTSNSSRPNDHSYRQHYTNSTCLLCFYIFILLFLFTIQLVIGLLSIMTVSPDRVFISSSTIAKIQENDEFLISVRESIDIKQLLVIRSEEIEPLYKPFRCCGWIYFDDYEFLDDPEHRNRSISVPDACCKTYVPNCGHRKHPNNIYYDGCWSKFGAEMRDYVLMLGWTALGFAIIELIGLMFAVCHYIQIVSKN
ncbi:Antigen -like protein [Sarcoptes scabiei]|uniref:Antigen -like protein n=2 Tax=Sarcoptes scabiei TaxID=52283 RepID=A0A834R2V4_SARSC|nr:Antigen -like protein [Sarcoptes scabiei]